MWVEPLAQGCIVLDHAKDTAGLAGFRVLLTRRELDQRVFVSSRIV